MNTERKISKFYTVIEREGAPIALYNHRTHHVYFIYAYGFCDISGTNLPYNSASELSIDDFYDKLEKR